MAFIVLYTALLQLHLTLFPTFLPAIEDRPGEYNSGTPSEMPVPTGKITRLHTAIHEQIQTGFVLQVEGM